MIEQDSIAHSSMSVQGGDSVVAKHVTLTPRMVLSWLPRDATPAQQDSAIQAHFKPSEIRWSKRPDTLHLPGHDKGHNMLDTQLPQYYREGFFSKDTLLHPELPGGRYGVAGDPVPYSVHGDSFITTLLLVLFVMALISISNAWGFIVRQVKGFVYPATSEVLNMTETAVELRFQTFLALLACVMEALLFYFYSLDHYGDTYVLSSPYLLILIFFGMTVGYYALKMLLYTVVNRTFFDGKRNRQWMKSFLFITSLEGALLFPLVVLHAYFNLSLDHVVFCFLVVLSIVKMLTIYRSFVIFFRRNVVQLQIILYFCTLEILPLLAFWSALEITAFSLKINF